MITNIPLNNKFNVKTIFPEIIDSNLTSSKEMLEDYTDFIKKVGFVDGQNYMANSIEIAIDYRNALKSPNPIQTLSDFFIDLNSKLKDQQNDFKEYWIQKFNSSIDEVRNIVLEKLKDNKQNFFNPVSDSIGSLYNLTPISNDSTLLVGDLNSDKGFSSLLPSSLKNKVSKAVQENCAELSIFTNRVFRNNLIQIQKGTYNGNLNVDSSLAHGQNLVNDLVFFNNFKKNIPNYITELNSFFGEKYEYVLYCSNINDNIALNLRHDAFNKQKTPDFFFNLNVEGRNQKVDLLQTKYRESISNITINQTLGVARQTNNNIQTSTQSIDYALLNQQNQEPFPEFASKNPFNVDQKQNDLNNNLLGLNDQLSFVSSLTDKLGIGGALQLSQPFSSEAISFVSNTFDQVVAPVNSVFGELGGFMQNVTNISSTNPISFANPMEAVQSIESMASNLTNTLNSIPFVDFALPSTDLGSFPQLAAIATNTNFKDLASNPLGVLELAQQVKDLICNFQLPIIGELDFSALLEFDFDSFDFDNMLKKIGQKFEKLWKDIEKFFTNLFDFNKLFKNFSSTFFDCDKNKN